MGRKKHYLMTCLALLFLGLIVARPGSAFNGESDLRSEREYQMNILVVRFEGPE
jgi:hypothetical protein